MDESQQKTLELIETYGLLDEAKAQAAARLLEKRREAAEQIAKLEAEKCKEIPRLREVEQKAKAEYDKVQAEALRLEIKANKAKADVWNASARYDHRVSRLKDILLESYDKAIDEAIEWFNDKLKWLREDSRIRYHFDGKENNLITLEVTKDWLTNRPAVWDCLEYCKTAIQILNQMKLAVEVDEKVIESLKTGLPDVTNPEAFTKISSVNDLDPQMSPRTKFLWDCLELEYDIERSKDAADRILKVGKYYEYPRP